MNTQIKSVLKILLISLVALFILIAVQVTADSIAARIICKVAISALSVWFMWNLAKLAFLLFIELWKKLISKLKTMFTKKHAKLLDETLIPKIEVKVHKKPKQQMYEHDFEDTYQYVR